MESKLLLEIKQLSNQNEIEKLETLLEQHLQQDSHNIDLLLRLALVELAQPLVDYPKSMICLNKILELDPQNSYAIILLVELQQSFLGEIDNELIKKLNKINLNDHMLQSVIEFEKAWIYRNNYPEKYVSSLLKSIQLDPSTVYPYKELAEYYIKTGQAKRAHELVQKALTNIRTIYNEKNIKSDCTDTEEYINEFLRGTKITDANAEEIKSLLKQFKD